MFIWDVTWLLVGLERSIFAENVCSTTVEMLNHGWLPRLLSWQKWKSPYNYTCDACSATYIGSTIKCLKTRADEHFGRSSRTGTLLVRPLQSKVREHIFSCNSVLSLDDFKILSSFNDHIQLRIAESLEIHFRKPNINGDLSSFPLLLV